MEIINPIVITLPGDKKNPKPGAETIGCATDALAPLPGKAETNACKYFDPCPAHGKPKTRL